MVQTIPRDDCLRRGCADQNVSTAGAGSRGRRGDLIRVGEVRDGEGAIAKSPRRPLPRNGAADTAAATTIDHSDRDQFFPDIGGAQESRN